MKKTWSEKVIDSKSRKIKKLQHEIIKLNSQISQLKDINQHTNEVLAERMTDRISEKIFDLYGTKIGLGGKSEVFEIIKSVLSNGIQN